MNTSTSLFSSTISNSPVNILSNRDEVQIRDPGFFIGGVRTFFKLKSENPNETKECLVRRGVAGCTTLHRPLNSITDFHNSNNSHILH